MGKKRRRRRRRRNGEQKEKKEKKKKNVGLGRPGLRGGKQKKKVILFTYLVFYWEGGRQIYPCVSTDQRTGFP